MSAAREGAAREEILARVRGALGRDSAAPVEVPREYRRRDESPRDAIVERFAERVAEYRATVFRAASGELAAALVAACRERGARRLGVPLDLPDAWRPDGLELVPDEGLSPHELDQLDGALTGCALAIAETGTVVLDGGVAQGRRALTLVPDYHLCVVESERVVGFVPEAVEALAEAVRAGRPLTFVSGPSATSDIELDRVEGVHGPRTLHVVIAA
jgi:L-lactate dehydrogenase complex protein LldG